MLNFKFELFQYGNKIITKRTCLPVTITITTITIYPIGWAQSYSDIS